MTGLELLSNAASGLGYVLDTPGALARGVLSGRPGERRSGREMLEDWGFLDENEPGLDAGDVAGFGAELLVDPLNLLTGGGLGLAKAGNKAARAANAVTKANAVHNSRSLAARVAGHMPEEVAALTKIADDAGRPLRTYHGTPFTFGEWRTDAMNRDALYGPGVYTTADPEIASQYARGSTQTHRSLSDSEIRDYFTPGRVVDSYGGGKDRVLESRFHDDGRWRDVLVEDVATGMKRRHGTPPQAWSAYADRRHPNIRMQYLDVRKPFDIDGPIGEAAPSLFKKIEGSPILEGNREYDDRTRTFIDDALTFFGPKTPGRNAYQLLEYASGDKAGANEALRELGFDAITHVGGGRMGGGHMHDVTIALDPSQVYKPYIAPALRNVDPWRPERSLNPYLALLAANNAGQAPYDLGK